MNTMQVGEKTKTIENQIGWKAKRELIRSIQEMKGGIPCFQTGKEFCDQNDCTWRSDCMPGGA